MDLKTKTNQPRKREMNGLELWWTMKSQKIQFFLYIWEKPGSGWDNIFQGSATGLGGTSGLKHREPKTQNKREGRLHSEAPISLACLLHI